MGTSSFQNDRKFRFELGRSRHVVQISMIQTITLSIFLFISLVVTVMRLGMTHTNVLNFNGTNQKVLSIVVTMSNIPTEGSMNLFDKDALLESLRSIARQEFIPKRRDSSRSSQFPFSAEMDGVSSTSSIIELIIIDTTCTPGMKGLISTIFHSTPSDTDCADTLVSPAAQTSLSCGKTIGSLFPKVHYFRSCDGHDDRKTIEKFNKFSFVASLRKEKLLANSEWTLFLSSNTELVALGDESFVQTMMDFATRSVSEDDGGSESATGRVNNVGVVGCKLVSSDGTNVTHGGGVLWNDGTTFEYQEATAHWSADSNKNKDIYHEELSYPRPVNYVSDSCMMIRTHLIDTAILSNANSRDHVPKKYDKHAISHFYDSLDVQMAVKYLQNDTYQIWYVPHAIAYSFTRNENTVDQLQDTARTDRMARFLKDWQEALMKYHMPSPFPKEMNDNGTNEVYLALLQARDTRQHQSFEGYKLNILYIDDRYPSRSAGSGYGRSLDNLNMIQQLGHRVTVTAVSPEGCDFACLQSIQSDGFEVIYQTPLPELLRTRKGYFQVIIVSRPSTYGAIHDTLHRGVSKMDSSVLYDAEALWYRRDETLYELLDNGYDAPGGIEYRNTYSAEVVERRKEIEQALLSDADGMVTVSQLEANIITDIVNMTNSHGSGGNLPHVSVIGHTMKTNDPTKPTFQQRNGILFVGAFSGIMYYNGDAIWDFLKYVYPSIIREDPTITLTIAGRKIPDFLFDFVHNNTETLYLNYTNNIRILESPKSIRSLYNKARIFVAPHLYGAGVQYKVSEAFAAGVPVAMSLGTAMNMGVSNTTYPNIGCIASSHDEYQECILSMHNDERTWMSYREGGLSYIDLTHQEWQLRDVWNETIELARQRLNVRKNCINECDNLPGMLFKAPMTRHCRSLDDKYIARYSIVGKLLMNATYISGADHFKSAPSSENFVYNLDDEANYLRSYPDALDLVLKEKRFVSGWDHFKQIGWELGYVYSIKDEGGYSDDYPDIAEAIKGGHLPTGWVHFDIWGGKNEGRKYGCF